MSRLVYYSQNREDVILKGFFPDITTGFYIDVGASHPRHFSVTKLFYDAGWRGINIDANPTLISALKHDRPHDFNQQIGIADKPGTLRFREYLGHGLSTFSNTIKDNYEQQEKNEATERYKDYEVEVTTLSKLLDVYHTDVIHFMKIDVEGFEYEVLKGNDWKKFRPQVICIEANHVVKDWRQILTQNQYQLAFFDGLNEYYCSIESGRSQQFNYVAAVINTRPISIEDNDATIRLQLDNERLERIIESLELEVTKQTKELFRLQRMRVMFKNTLRSLNGIVTSRLAVRPLYLDKRSPLADFQTTNTENTAAFLQNIHAYDYKQYAFSSADVKKYPKLYKSRLNMYKLYNFTIKSLFKSYMMLKKIRG